MAFQRAESCLTAFTLRHGGFRKGLETWFCPRPVISASVLRPAVLFLSRQASVLAAESDPYGPLPPGWGKLTCCR